MTAYLQLYIVHTNAYSTLQIYKTLSLEQLNFEASGSQAALSSDFKKTAE